MLCFVLQLLRSLAVLVTLLLQSCRGKRDQQQGYGNASPTTAGLPCTRFNMTPMPLHLPAKSRVYCSLERSI